MDDLREKMEAGLHDYQKSQEERRLREFALLQAVNLAERGPSKPGEIVAAAETYLRFLTGK